MANYPLIVPLTPSGLKHCLTGNINANGTDISLNQSEAFPFQINPKNLDPSYKTDLDFGIVLEEKIVFTAWSSLHYLASHSCSSI